MKPTRLFDFLAQQLENPLEKCLNTKYNGKWEATSTLVPAGVLGPSVQ